MKLFHDCEVIRSHVRGHAAVYIAGDRAVTVDEGAALLAEFVASFGDAQRPMYFSGEGWQALVPAAPEASPAEAQSDDAPADTPAPAKSSKKKA